MGISDRGYMRKEPNPTGLGFTNMFRVCAAVALFAIALICLRLPIPAFVKITPFCLSPLISIRLFAIPHRTDAEFLLQRGRELECEGRVEAAIRSLEQALKNSSKDSSTKLRLLAAYNPALQSNKAKDLI